MGRLAGIAVVVVIGALGALVPGAGAGADAGPRAGDPAFRLVQVAEITGGYAGVGDPASSPSPVDGRDATSTNWPDTWALVGRA